MMLFTPNDTKKLFLILVLLVITFNLREWPAEFREIRHREKTALLAFPGFKFSGLEDILREVKSVAYLTDKDLSLPEHQLQFSQAQYVLAPAILRLNDTTARLFLLDFTDETKAAENIKSLGLVPLKKNQYGIILAGKPYG